MSSYVDLMGDVRWNEQQHIRKTEAMVREHWTADDEAILNRKVAGAQMGRYTMTAEDITDVTDFNQVTMVAQMVGIQARTDSLKLDAALDYEQTAQELASIPPVPEEGEDLFVELRSQLLLSMAAISDAALELVLARAAAKPPIAPVEEPAEPGL